MSCPSVYDELMSLKLDGLIASKDEAFLTTHLSSCRDCSLMWHAINDANNMLLGSARTPLPVPDDLRVRVMVRITSLSPATTLLVPAGEFVTMPAGSGNTVLLDAELWLDLQHRLKSLIRGAAAALLVAAGTVAMLLALVLSGALKLSGDWASAFDGIRTFIGTSGTWVRSLSIGTSAGVWTAAGIVLAVLVVAGWQIVSSYHLTATQDMRKTTFLDGVEPAVA